MRKIILTVLATSLMAASTVQFATAAERHGHRTYRDSFRGAYNQVNGPSQQGIGTFDFGARDPSRIGGQDPSFNPAGN